MRSVNCRHCLESLNRLSFKIVSIVRELGFPCFLTVNWELKQIDEAAVNKQISIQKDSRPSEFSRPLT